MKRKSLAYRHWNCTRDLYGISVNEPWLEGCLWLYEIKEAEEPLFWSFQGKKFTICEKGLSWLTVLPKSGGFCMTALLDQTCEIVLWYLDMIAGQGVDEEGIPYFDDLYLDLILYPDGTMAEDDRDELEEARCQGDITESQYQEALQTCAWLEERLSGKEQELEEYTKRCYAVLQEEKYKYTL